MYLQSGNWGSYFPWMIVTYSVNSHLRFYRLQTISPFSHHIVLISLLSVSVVRMSLYALYTHLVPDGSFQKMVESLCLFVNIRGIAFSQSRDIFLGDSLEETKWTRSSLSPSMPRTNPLGFPLLFHHKTTGSQGTQLLVSCESHCHSHKGAGLSENPQSEWELFLLWHIYSHSGWREISLIFLSSNISLFTSVLQYD